MAVALNANESKLMNQPIRFADGRVEGNTTAHETPHPVIGQRRSVSSGSPTKKDSTQFSTRPPANGSISAPSRTATVCIPRMCLELSLGQWSSGHSIQPASSKINDNNTTGLIVQDQTGTIGQCRYLSVIPLSIMRIWGSVISHS